MHPIFWLDHMPVLRALNHTQALQGVIILLHKTRPEIIKTEVHYNTRIIKLINRLHPNQHCPIT